MAMLSSTRGYWMEIRILQERHLPRSKMKLTIGMFSYQRSTAWQPGQCEEGKTIEAPWGILIITTFRKLPTMAPNRTQIVV